jgi:hypothetical protein
VALAEGRNVVVLHAKGSFGRQNTHLVIVSLSMSVILIRNVNSFPSDGCLEVHCLKSLQSSIVFCENIAHATIHHLLEHCLLFLLTFLLNVGGTSQEIDILNW